jgi:hypothetical protein
MASIVSFKKTSFAESALTKAWTELSIFNRTTITEAVKAKKILKTILQYLIMPTWYAVSVL